MRKGFLLKTLLLVVALAAVVVVIAVTISIDFNDVTKKASQKHTFFSQFVIAGGPIVWFILLPMSLTSVYLAAKYCFVIRRGKLLPQDTGRTIVEMIQKFGVGQLKMQIAGRDDFVSTAVVRAVVQGGSDAGRMRELVDESLQEQALPLLREIEWLNLIGNVSPMVGLFGTIVGMIQLFNAIVVAGGQPQPAQLAGGISVALVTTFWGLLIAIPALAVHSIFRNRIETLVNAAAAEAETILSQIIRNLKTQRQVEQMEQKQPIRELTGKPVGTIGKSVSSL
jgi:biopolymer transport protein ExbB